MILMKYLNEVSWQKIERGFISIYLSDTITYLKTYIEYQPKVINIIDILILLLTKKKLVNFNWKAKQTSINSTNVKINI